MPTSPSPVPEPSDPWAELPTETEIYILPDGRVVVADLPEELAAMLQELGTDSTVSQEHTGPLPSTAP